jgi:hypothetical protein
LASAAILASDRIATEKEAWGATPVDAVRDIAAEPAGRTIMTIFLFPRGFP